jgi:hypothetical protein
MASGLHFMFCAPGLVLGGTEGVGSRFNDLRANIRFRRYRGRRVSFSCFALPDTFSAISRASSTVFMFCAPGLIFGGTEGVGSRFHVSPARTHLWRYRGRRFPLSCFVLPNSFSAVPRASGPVLMFCTPGLIFSGTDGVRSRFNVLRSQTHFRRCRVRRFPFLCFTRPDSFLAVPRTSDHVFLFSAPGHVFGGAEGVGSRFHVLHSRTRF